MTTEPKKRSRRRDEAEAVRGRVRAHDPFELIRWLAMSQPDPRKALAELVQNSLDAQARKIRVTRVRERGRLCLRIMDDGDGVIPEMDRPEALRYIATHIGHSRKRSLSPEERLALMTQGQYGIGLLGFWSLGHALEMRTSVPGQRPFRLLLHRDRPDFLIEPLHGRLPMDERWTEIVVADLHREANSALTGRRAADYLASELRGQLLARDVDLVIEDRVSRGPAQKAIAVRPPRFLGERIAGIGPIDVPGHSPVRLEVYLVGDEAEAPTRRGLSVYAAGTLVAEGFEELAPLGLDRQPWTDLRLTGMVDFPSLHIAPGSRRGIVVDETASMFALALGEVEPALSRVLETYEQQRSEELDRTLVRDLQRAFRDFYRQRPRFAMLPVKAEQDQSAGPGDGPSEARGGSTDGAADRGAREGETEAEEAGPAVEQLEPAPPAPPPPAEPPGDSIHLFPPGPLASVRITPERVRVECAGTRRLRAEGLDGTGRPVEGAVEFVWSLTPGIGTLDRVEGTSAAVVFTAGAEPANGMIEALARSGGLEAITEVPVEVLLELNSGRSGEGIPRPEFVHQPGAPWRSRMVEERWEVNSAHRDYRAIADRPALKLRYLAALFAKEVVLRSHQDPRLDKPLEQMAEIVSYADLNLSSRRGGRGPGSTQSKPL